MKEEKIEISVKFLELFILLTGDAILKTLQL